MNTLIDIFLTRKHILHLVLFILFIKNAIE